MNAISNLYIKHLIIDGYKAAFAVETEICNRTDVNDTERNAALYNCACYSDLIDVYGFQKEIGRTYWNSWD